MQSEIGLNWLPLPDDLWTERLAKSSHLANDRQCSALVELSKFQLSENQLVKLNKRFQKVDPVSHDGLTSIKIHIIGDLTLDHLQAPIVASGLRRGLNLEVTTSSFGQSYQELLDSKSPIFDSSINLYFVFIITNDKIFSANGGSASPFGGEKAAARVIEFFKFAKAQISTNNPAATCLLSTMPDPENRYFGSMERSLGDSKANAVTIINEYVRNSGSNFIDIAFFANSVGLNNWYDNKYYDLAKYPFSPTKIPAFCDFVAKSIAPIFGATRKCLVVDLDNTLWGGVIGDDGVDQIEIGEETPAGQSFLRIQQTLLNLKERGIILAVCSKNDHTNAVLPFRNRPEMLLKESDFSAFLCNWDDKASNIVRIASQLSIAVESIVFLDDNPVERDLVRQFLPKVAVIELSEDPAYYSNALMSSGLFDSIEFTTEDSLKNQQYSQKKKAEKHAAEFSSIEDFLANLEMIMSFDQVTTATKRRAVQLINKTNQFNCTGERISAEEFDSFISNKNNFVFCIGLDDKFGQNGMISVVMCSVSGSKFSIQNWVMSCRVLKRGLENAVMSELVLFAKTRSLSIIEGKYINTTKNGMVARLYEGFNMNESDDAWSGELDEIKSGSSFIQMR